MMEWVLTLTSGIVVLCLLGPLVMLLGGLMLFGLSSALFAAGHSLIFFVKGLSILAGMPGSASMTLCPLFSSQTL